MNHRKVGMILNSAIVIFSTKMKYFIIAPPPPLKEHVRYFWALEGEASTNTPYVHRTMADGCAELVFHYRGVFDEITKANEWEKSYSAGLSGPSSQFRRFTIRQNFGIFGAYLYPFAASQLFSISGPELSNNMLDMKTIDAGEGLELEEKISLAQDHVARMNIISTYLLMKLTKTKKQPPGVFEAIKYLICTQGEPRVKELAQRNFTSIRQFERNFKHFTGFSPKFFSRIIRFQSSLREYGDKNKSLTEIAYKYGYYDQSHFIQDFKEFSGYNPRRYFSGKNEATDWRD